MFRKKKKRQVVTDYQILGNNSMPFINCSIFSDLSKTSLQMK